MERQSCCLAEGEEALVGVPEEVVWGLLGIFVLGL
jgi:hypothetical protein